MHLINHHDYLRLSYRPDLRLLFMRWVRPVSSEEHREGYHVALALGREQACGCWLIDLRARGLASVEDFAWVLRAFRERLAEAVPAPRRIAYLVTPYQAEVMNERLRQLEPEVPEATRLGAAVQAFTEELPAQHWLQAGR
ncbi:hypothetical protein D3Y59_13235 [Hymenobacter oligotrophus]|uniref:STAS/SEC14 domain-containing protein n=1 Tax=Hymenobacter oligotrophus TaxID=2319843 RepID=A0A3B7R3D5_9BACT|nr:hypothetical protein [Hymenobacter oligotrophus]AYA37923.1 hypothetical protein D3Y59_13235 [Hymenobacter oligotrophus]